MQQIDKQGGTYLVPLETENRASLRLIHPKMCDISKADNHRPKTEMWIGCKAFLKQREMKLVILITLNLFAINCCSKQITLPLNLEF